MSEVERRRTRRFSMSLPISVADESAGIVIQSVTHDVSLSGVSFVSTTEFAVGATVAFDLELPYEIMLAEPVRAHCKGHVVRLEPYPDGGGFVTAIRVNKFEFGRARENVLS
jgi:PilZ domain-containing protein